MNRLSLGVFLLASSLVSASQVLAQSGDRPLALTNVTVIDVAQGVAVAARTVVVEGDRITAVGAANEVEVPAGAAVVDGTGKFLIPGLWDMHAHSWEESIHRDIFLPLYVAHGVTGVREMSGEPYELEARAEVAAGTLLGPRTVVSSPIVDGPNPISPGTHRPRVADAAEARRTVDALHAQGYDLIQTHQFLSPAAYRALHERAREIGMEVSGTVPMSVSLWEAAALGHRTVEHLWGVELACSSREEELRVDYRRRVEEISADTSLRTHVAVWTRTELEPLRSIDPTKCRALYRHLAANETWVVPTLLIQRLMAYASDAALQNDPRQRYLPGPGWAVEEYADFYDPERRLRATYEHRLRTLVDLQRAGVGILAGSEVQAGFSLHDELALYVESGLTPLEALRTATLNPARYLNATDSLGTVERGKLADLVLLDANPLEDISNTQRISAVVLDGRYLDRRELDALLAQAEAKAGGAAAGASTSSDTVHVAPPTGEQAADRASILTTRVIGPDTPTTSSAYENRFIDAGGVRLHYLDFGGEGLPIVFVHSESWDAHTYQDFAPRFTRASRVLAVTRPGYGESEAHPDGFDVAAQAESLIDFLDALGIERAVFAGNSSPTVHLTYLAEHHPDRVAGVIYLAGLLTPWLREVRDSDPAGAGVMAARVSAPDATARERREALFSYRPESLAGDRPPIEVPALAFTGRSGTIGHERFSEPLAVVGSALMANFFAALPPSPFRNHFQRLIEDPAFRSESLRAIEDAEAREFLLRLAEDSELQAQVWRYQLETAGPAVLAGQDRFRRAFDCLRLVPLDVSTVYGYEYRESPELIEPHIRRFLADLERIAAGSQDTTRYTVIVTGQPAGERLSWAESPDTWRYSARGPPAGFRRTSRIVLDAEGLPRQMEIAGRKNPMEAWEERFHLDAGRATWSTPVDHGELTLSGPAYYTAIHPAHDLGILARALLRRPTGVLPLLPEGEAWLEPLETRVVAVDGRDRTIRLYAIHGLDLRPRYVWLDEKEATFADEWSVLAGWETAFPALRAAIGGAIAEHMRRMARTLTPPTRERSLVIQGARLFDPETHAVHSGTTIIVEDNRVLAVGPDGTVDIAADAEVVHAEGRMVLPGLWDMHAHQDPARYSEWVGPVHLAAGVTTTRDMGSNADMLVLLRQRIDAGEVMGPRIIMAGFIEGIGGSRTGIQVENAADAQAAVDRYAGLGFVQLKIYNQVPADLVPVAIERAKHHGMRVSGHIPWEMTGREAVESGFDEIQHMTVLMEGMALDPDEDVTDSDIANALAGLTPESELVRDFIGLLASHDVAVDPTLAFFHSTGAVPPTWVADVLDRLPPQARRRWLDRSAPLWAGERWSEILANQFGIVRALHQAGVAILPGTDMMPGFGLHKELELYVEAGIPAPEVLTLATLGAARVMGMDAELGSIEPGKLADLILVDGDPTTDISDIRRVVTVVKDGRVYDPVAIYSALGMEPCCPDTSRPGGER